MINGPTEPGRRRGPGIGATLGNVKRRLRPTLVPRSRKASDGTSKVVTNPRISAGSTVEIAGPECVRAHFEEEEAQM